MTKKKLNLFERWFARQLPDATPIVEGHAQISESLKELRTVTDEGFKKVTQNLDVLQRMAKNMRTFSKATPVKKASGRSKR